MQSNFHSYLFDDFKWKANFLHFMSDSENVLHRSSEDNELDKPCIKITNTLRANICLYIDQYRSTLLTDIWLLLESSWLILSPMATSTAQIL